MCLCARVSVCLCVCVSVSVPTRARACVFELLRWWGLGALGMLCCWTVRCVYKLVEIAGTPRIKLSQDVAKVMIPGQKRIYRVFNKAGEPMVDLIKRKLPRATSAG